MYIILSLIILFSSTLSFRLNVGQNRFSKVVIFGDSFSDTGNAYNLTNYTWPISPPYYQGRFSNGPNWVDRLSTIPVTNRAYGSATTDSILVQGLTKSNTIPVPGVRQQIDAYFNITPNNTIDFPHTLFIVWAGGNDFIFNATLPLSAIITSLINRVQQLLTYGAKHVLVFNQPPIQYFPYISRLNQTTLYTSVATSANGGIVSGLANLQQVFKNSTIHLFDVYTLFVKLLTNSSIFTNTVGRCWDNYNITTVSILCSDPTQYFFLDSLHFTSGVHRIIADSVRPFFTYRFNNNTPGCYFRSFP